MPWKFVSLNGFMVRCVVNSHNFECVPCHGIAHNIVPRLVNLMKVPHHWWSMGKQLRICSITKLSTKRGRRWHNCLHESLCSMGFRVKGPSKSSFL
jgi:hypothetical protein